MNEAVNRINNGEEPSEVLAWVLSESGQSFASVSQQIRFAAKSRPHWGDICSRLLTRKRPSRARAPKPPKPPRPVRVPRPRGRPVTDTPYKLQRRGAIVDALSKHAGGLTTTALLKVAGCTERILRDDLRHMAEKGILVQSEYRNGCATIWRLAK